MFTKDKMRKNCKNGKLLLNAQKKPQNIYNHRKIIWQACGMSEKVQEWKFAIVLTHDSLTIHYSQDLSVLKYDRYT